MGKRDQDHFSHPGFQGRCEEIREPSGVGLGQEALRPGSEQDPGEVDDDVRAGQGGSQGLRTREIRLDGYDARGAAEIFGKSPAMEHQAQVQSARKQVAGQQPAEVSRGAGDQDRRRSIHAAESPVRLRLLCVVAGGCAHRAGPRACLLRRAAGGSSSAFWIQPRAVSCKEAYASQVDRAQRTTP